jgi:hypothetical protein
MLTRCAGYVLNLAAARPRAAEACTIDRFRHRIATSR